MAAIISCPPDAPITMETLPLVLTTINGDADDIGRLPGTTSSPLINFAADFVRRVQNESKWSLKITPVRRPSSVEPNLHRSPNMQAQRCVSQQQNCSQQ